MFGDSGRPHHPVLALGCAIAVVAALIPSAAAAVLPTTWLSAPAPVFEGDTQDPVLALSADGSMATALWKSGNGTCNNILTASATIAGNVASWGSVTTLTDCSDGDMENPAIAVSADGTTAVAVWNQQIAGTTAEVQTKSASIAGNEGSWTDGSIDPTIIQFVGGVSPQPDVAVSSDGSTAGISFATNSGDALTPPRQQSIGTKFATVAGGAATWEDDVQYISGDGSLASDNVSSIAISADGTRGVVAFLQLNASSAYAVFAANAAVAPGATPTDPPSATWADEVELYGESGRFPQLSEVKISADGSMATALWGVQGGGQYTVQAASSTLSAGSADWEDAPHTLVTSTYSVSEPAFGLSADGNFATAVWSRNTGNSPRNPVVEASSAVIAGASAQWGTVTTIDSGVIGYNPNVAVSEDGSQATAVWANENSGELRASSADVAGISAEWSTPSDLIDDDATAWPIPALGLSSDGSRATTLFANTSNTALVSASAVRTYRVTFAANGGDGTMTAVADNTAAKLPANQFTRPGYQFDGWNTKADGSGAEYPNEGVYSFRSNAILHAQWRTPTDREQTATCVRDQAKPGVPTSGRRVLTDKNCFTNANQRVGTRLASTTPRGDLRAPQLLCVVGGKLRPTHAASYGAKYRYCNKGKLIVRTHGSGGSVKVRWFAPQTEAFDAFTRSRKWTT